MNLAEAVKSVLGQYATFSGRARRSEYWFWYLATFLVSFVAALVDGFVFDGRPVLQVIIVLAVIVPTFAVGARRLHDTGRSGWWQLIGLIPLIGAIILIVWFATDSKPDNEYGPNPKGGPVGATGSSFA